MFYHDKDLTINFNFRNNNNGLMFFSWLASDLLCSHAYIYIYIKVIVEF